MKFSMVTPSFNQGRFIRMTLESVAGQGGADIEHVVMDGGSTDETTSVLAEFGPRVRWVSEPDRGQTDAINKGIRATDGDVIGWINSDDVYYPGAIAAVAGFLAAHPDVDVVYGMADHIDADGNFIEAYPTEPWRFERLKETCFICQPALFFRRRVVERVGLLDEALHYCMDYEYWIRMGLAGVRFAYLPRKLAGSRMYGENKTLGARMKVHREINDMMKRAFGKVPERWLCNYAHVVVDERVDRSAEPARFARAVAMESLRAAITWNRIPSPRMCTQVARWVIGA
ncbi:MAG TPA: glycosyltransferase family 2 protein [Burkholderiaceae bacterium]|nr:glycosyltransferase family 2 protein [Burkholderiaceae bacterium]